MFLAVILENFDVATRENAEPLTADDFEQFFEVWQKFDDKLTQLISYDQLQLLLHQLDMPLKGIPFDIQNYCVINRVINRVINSDVIIFSPIPKPAVYNTL